MSAPELSDRAPAVGRVVEYHGLRRLVVIDDNRLIPAAGGRWLVQSQPGPMGAWSLVQATNDPELAHRLLHAGRVGGV